MTDTVTVPEPHGSESTRRENAEKGFVAPESLTKNLQNVLVDFIALSLVAKQAHWNIVGTNFRDLHLNLDEVTTVARNGSDALAERMRALHGSPDGRPAVIAAQTDLATFPAGEITTHDAIDHVVGAIETTVASMRGCHDEVDSADPTTADLFHEYIAQLEQQAWFISAETRRPS
jgi:starvation-inducible DNA-binding protein